MSPLLCSKRRHDSEPNDFRGTGTSSRLAPQTAQLPSRLGRLGYACSRGLVRPGWRVARGGTRVLCRAIDPTKRLYLMTRHFVWLTPLVNLLVFLGLGLCLAGLTRLWPRLGGMVGPRLICALAILPVLMVAGPPIFPEAWFVLALGIASWLVPWLERRPAVVRRRLVRGFPFCWDWSSSWPAPSLVGLAQAAARGRPALCRRPAHPTCS